MGIGRADERLKSTAAPKSGGQVLDGRAVHPHGVPQRRVMLGGFKETSDNAFIVGPLVRRERVMNPLRHGEVFIPDSSIRTASFTVDEPARRRRLSRRRLRGGVPRVVPGRILSATSTGKFDVLPSVVQQGEGGAERIEEVPESWPPRFRGHAAIHPLVPGHGT